MTIYDIATAAGVSASTVSRVINHKSGIRKETREKIEKLIEEYNYSPNVAARGLVMQSSKTTPSPSSRSLQSGDTVPSS